MSQLPAAILEKYVFALVYQKGVITPKAVGLK